MVSRIRERLVLVLLALLPFHALGVTVLTRAVAGPNHAPLGALALWKEALLAIILVLACIEWVTTKGQGDQDAKRLDVLDVCIVIVTFCLLFASLLASWSLGFSPSFFYGIRYDLVPLAAFVILRRVPWSQTFLKKLPVVLAGAVFLGVLYGLLTLVLPASFFATLGYSDLHSLYVPSGPVAPFQQIGGTALRRMQGAMSGPNQFGIWLAALLPVVLALGGRWRRFVAPLALLAIVLSFSRAAWIAAAAVMLVSLWPALRKSSVTAVGVLCIGILALFATAFALFPSVILRIESSSDHLKNPMTALGIMVREPLGRGLGSAGPANNRVSDACVLLQKGSDILWAAAHPQLCVFVDGVQLQPALDTKKCHCALLPENWYLQLGVEGGWVAMIAFIALIILVIRRLWPTPPALGLLAVAIAGMFLHAWEDAAVAYASWILCAIAITPTWDSASRH